MLELFLSRQSPNQVLKKHNKDSKAEPKNVGTTNETSMNLTEGFTFHRFEELSRRTVHE